MFGFTASAGTGNITGSFNSTTGVLTLTSTGATATVAQFQTALRSVTYSNSSDNPTTTARNISFVVNDGSLNSNIITSTVNIIAVDDAPILFGSSNITYVENNAPTVINNSISIADLDNSTLFSATVAITNFVSGQDLLGFTVSAGTGNITGSVNNSTGILTLSSAGATATVAQFQTALRAITYSNSSDNPGTTTRNISFVVNDGSLNSNVVASTINIIAVDDVPVLFGSSNITYTENSSPAVINNNIGIADLDNSTLPSATVSITNFVSGEDLLAFTASAGTGNIAGSFNSTTGVLTLISTGATATVAQFQTALRAVTYSNSSDNPNTAARNISFVANDGSLNSNVIASTVNIIAVDDAPVIFGSSSITYTENNSPAVINNSISIADLDNATLFSATVAITNFVSSEDLLGFSLAAGTGNITGSFNSTTGVLTFSSAGGTATLAQFQTALRTVFYSNSSDNPSTTPRNISFVVNDGSLNSNVVISTVNIIAVDDAPVLFGSSTITYVENSLPAVINNNIGIVDVDNLTLPSATIAITNFVNGQDVLVFTASAGTGNITGSFNSTTGLLTLTSSGATATVAQFQTALRAVTYFNTSDNPTTTARTISFVVNDGSLNSNVIACTVNVIAVNDAPVLSSIESSSLSYPTLAALVAVTSTIAVTDPDNTTLTSATVSIGNFVPAEDVLSFTGGAATGNVVGVFNNVSGILTLSSAGATATLAQWQNALRAVKYSNLSAAPSGTTRTISFMVNEGTLTGNVQTRSVTVGSVVAVTLINIAAFNSGTENRIEWQTASETSLNSFEVQRSFDGIHFEDLLNIAAAGFATTYTVFDHNPADGINYYRLKIISGNEPVVYSIIVHAVNSKSGKNLFVYPNPASRMLNVEFAGDDHAAVLLYDILGRTIMQTNLINGRLRVDVTGLSAGTYFLHIKATNSAQQILIVK